MPPDRPSRGLVPIDRQASRAGPPTQSASRRVLRPGEGSYVVIGDRARCTFKIVGAETGGQFGLFEYVMEPKAQGAAPHVHHQLTEIFYVAEGKVELILGQERHLAPRGS